MGVMQQPEGRLRSIVERIERLEEEKEGIATDIREVYAEAKGAGFDTKTLRKVIRLRKIDRTKREEEEALLATYMAALGMLPLEAASNRHGNAESASQADLVLS